MNTVHMNGTFFNSLKYSVLPLINKDKVGSQTFTVNNCLRALSRTTWLVPVKALSSFTGNKNFTISTALMTFFYL